MANLRQICLASMVVCAMLSTVAAQESSTGAKATLTITVNATGERVRITAPSSVVQMHVEVYAASGEKLFDQEIRGGNVFDWHVQDGQARRLAPGAYVCVVTAKSVSGRLTQKLGTVTVAEKSVSVQAGSLQLSLQQTQAIGPVEADSSWTIAGENEPQTPTVIANDGSDGQMIRGRGALTFRIGNFFSGIDTEQMRLTEAGDLGIGTSQPQSKLDVAGIIRAERFVVVKPTVGNGDKTAAATQTTDGADAVQPLVAGTGTQNQIAKWTDNAGTLGDSGITEAAGGNVGIGTTSPGAKLQVGGTVLATGGFRDSGTAISRFENTFNALPTGAAGKAVEIGVESGTDGLIQTYDRTGGALIPLHFSGSKFYFTTGNVGIGTTSPNRTLTVEGSGLDVRSSAGYFVNLNYAYSSTVASLYALNNSGGIAPLSINPDGGNVGIGTTAPATPLEVNGVLRSTRIGFGTQYLQLNGGDNTFIKLTAQSIATAEKPLLIQNLTGEVTPGANNNIQFQLGTPASPSTKMMIDKDGRVGIGTAPSADARLVAVGGLNSAGLRGESTNNNGVSGISFDGPGLHGVSTNNVGVFGRSTNGLAGFFDGNVVVSGTINKAAVGFKIDHPLDPANKYLYHTGIESPDMLNLYNGNLTTDANGEATVRLPEWFEALNRDFRYQLTVIGEFAQAMVATKIKNHQFTVKTDKPRIEVSWQVTGIRQDAYANAHRMPIEEEKAERERGYYLRPELFGQPEEKGVEWAQRPEQMRQMKEQREKAQQQRLQQ